MHRSRVTPRMCADGDGRRSYSLAFAAIAEVCWARGLHLSFGQLFHPGREIMESQDGSARPSPARPSAVPNERFHVMPKPMSKRMIREGDRGIRSAAVRPKAAGPRRRRSRRATPTLPAQFLNRGSIQDR